jgi:hypothetical protein
MREKRKLGPVIMASVIAAAALAAVALAGSWTGTPSAALWFWAGACLMSELLWVRLPVGEATISMATCFNFAAMLVLPRAEAMIAVGLSVAVAELAFMRKPPVRVVFNVGQAMLSVAAGALAFTLLAGDEHDPVALFTALHFAPFVVAGLVYSIVNTGAVSVPIALSEGISVGQAWRRNFGNGFELLSRGALLSLGVLVAIQHAFMGPLGTLLVVLPLLLARYGYERHLGGKREAKAGEERKAA